MSILKQLIYKLYSIIFILKNRLKTNSSIIFKLDLRISRLSHVYISKATIIKSIIECVSGVNNIIRISGYCSNLNILINGDNNQVIIHRGVKCNKTNIIIRGNRNRVEIMPGTTIGSSYMVCMGVNNHVTINEGSMLADNIEIWATDSHPIFDNETNNLINISLPIEIGPHAWIGKGASILKGVTIGLNSIVGMNATVTKSVPDGCICAGNPARIIRKNINWKREFIDH